MSAACVHVGGGSPGGANKPGGGGIPGGAGGSPGCSDWADRGRKAGDSMEASWGTEPASEPIIGDESAGDWED